MDVVDAMLVALGLSVVALILLDAFDTLLATNISARRWSPSTAYFAVSWRLYRGGCARVGDDHRRERWLALYGPASFVALLLGWTVASILGWGLVWWGLRSQFAAAPASFGDAVYYAGVSYLSIGFGDLLPGSGVTKLLSVAAALDGLGTLGLVIGYLPTLSAAYKEREVPLLLLDDLTDARITPVSLIASRLGPDGDTSELDAMFREWEHWCAAVFESHSSLPMLVLWRSKHRGHSWITALGVVTDAAIDHIALVEGAERGPAMRLYRQSVRLVTFVSDRFGIEPPAYEPPPTSRYWSVAYTSFSRLGTAQEMRPFDESWTVLHDLRAPFHPHMEVFIDILLAPRGFWASPRPGPTSWPSPTSRPTSTTTPSGQRVRRSSSTWPRRRGCWCRGRRWRPRRRRPRHRHHGPAGRRGRRPARHRGRARRHVGGGQGVRRLGLRSARPVGRGRVPPRHDRRPGSDPDPSARPDVVNLSAELPPGTVGLDPLIGAFAAAGVAAVFAVGNGGPGCATVGEPAAGTDAFAVAAVDRAGDIDPRSYRGPGDGDAGKPDVAAPGVDVVTSGIDGGYVEVSGSSMATPVVAGAAALALSSPSPPAADDLLAQVRASAHPVPATACSTSGTPNSTYGSGCLDVAALVAAPTDGG